MTPEALAPVVAAMSRAERAALRAELDALDLREAVAEVMAAHTAPPAAPSRDGRRGTYSVAEAARYLQCSTDQVYQLIHAGELPAARLGRAFALRREVLEAYLVAHERRADAQRIELGASKRGRNGVRP